jgi:hypothetical protein
VSRDKFLHNAEYPHKVVVVPWIWRADTVFCMFFPVDEKKVRINQSKEE